MKEVVQALLLGEPLDEMGQRQGDVGRAASRVRDIRIGAHLAARGMEGSGFGWTDPKKKAAPSPFAASGEAQRQTKAKAVEQPSPAPKLEKPKS